LSVCLGVLMRAKPTIAIECARRRAAVDRVRKVGGRLPTGSEFADPGEVAAISALARRDAGAPDAANLLRVRWLAGPVRKTPAHVRGHVVLQHRRFTVLSSSG